ncbi:ABC transporter substrate-binding protein [Sulfitobacter aestuariivivens]|uniref:ABC transporter substrate-binding protein n=1 Tax=Sulfitobacter aestuariivivens TaxID=2766981 RepID=A0A927HH67_9RHOB|nr:ABC transporter substrate-binding protein [Sulfitobacter aestuariivivens]MBD3664960.1 ABC transporter substrate-binding protein [Sulfitobacter aestuariivivens]
MKNMLKTASTGLALSLGLATAGLAQTQGVTDSEVIIGSNQDMSGPFAAFGAPAITAANLYFDEVNAAGGVHGRQIRLVVEDHAYQMPKAMSGLNKLVNSDKVFAMLLSLGTPMNIASFPLLENKGVPNINPLTAARQMIDPPSPIKFAGTSSYYDQMLTAVEYMKTEQGRTNVCAMYIPSDFGIEIQEGAVDAAEKLGIPFLAETKHKPDELDFVGSLTLLKSEGCDLIAVALGVRQVITAVATAKKIGWDDVKFLGASASFHTAIAKVPGGVTEGFYAAAGWSDLEARLGEPEVGAWVKKYSDATGEALPGTGALLGHSAAVLLVKALEAAGPDLTSEGFIAAMEGLSYEDKIANNTVDFSADDHQAADAIVISRVEGGSWAEVARID